MTLDGPVVPASFVRQPDQHGALIIHGSLQGAPSTPSSRSVLEVILRQGPVSRAELARITGLSKQTTSEVVRTLLEGGWVRVQGQVQGATGRSAVTYEMRADAAFVLSIDLGGTKLHVALADLGGVIVGEHVTPTDRRGGMHVIRQVGAVSERLRQQAGVAPGALHGAVMGSPGVFDPRSGRILLAPNVSGLDGMDVADALTRQLNCPVQVENDVNLAANGERWQGCCTGVETFAFVALGTGIGMGVVADGRLLRGARGAAGEIAYLPLGGDPFDARGYRLGTLESAIGSAAILDRYHGLGGAPAEDVRAVFDRLEQGDPAAGATMDEVARLLAQVCMALRAVLDPERIVFGGSIGARAPLLERVRALLDRHMADPVPVQASALGSRAAIAGGVGLALTRLHDSLFIP